MLGYQLLYLISFVTYTFGALTFSVLTVFYWRERRLRLHPGGGSIFPVFTVVCAAAFLMNLLLRLVGDDSRAAAVLTIALNMATGLLPPLLLHLIYREEQAGLSARRIWAWGLAVFYASSAATAALGDRWDALDSAPALRLAAAGIAGLAMQMASRRHPTAAERAHRRWNSGLLLLTVAVAALNLGQAAPVWSLLPDYLLLGFFCVTLYYKERLVFFDLLIKRGAFFALSLIALTAFFAAAPPLLQRLPADWSQPWFSALLLTPLWLAAPWIYRHLARAIDHVWLRRRYSPAEAERRFIGTVQAAGTEEQLKVRAVESLGDIFQASAEVCFDGTGPQYGRLAGENARPTTEDRHFAMQGGPGIHVSMERQGTAIGWMALAPRPDSIPYLSDDHRLVQSLSRTLGVVLDNVRFREREQHLRWLAGRAELRALRAQINPHFLFNALNAIAGLIPDQPLLADETVEQLAQVFRYTLSKSEKEWVRLEEEVEFAAAYLRVEQARFGDRLRVEFDVDPDAGAIEVPAMSIQPLIENAVKHGVSAVEGRGTVRLRARLLNEALSIEVLDNGPGFPPGFSLTPAAASNGGGYGLRNVAERLRGYYGDSALLRWENGAEDTRVILRIPPRVPPRIMQ